MEIMAAGATFVVDRTPDGRVSMMVKGSADETSPSLTLAGDEARDLADILARVGCQVDGLVYGGLVFCEGDACLDPWEPDEPDEPSASDYDDDFPLYLEYETPGMAGDFWVEQMGEEDW